MVEPARVRVVLVRPENPANVGAAARALRNGGLEDLVLVAPGDWRTVECWRTAWGAHDVLERTREVPDLAAALADTTHAVALSGRRRSGAPPVDVRDAAVDLHARGGLSALVFGPETSGLTDAEIDRCARTAIIPSHPGQPSLNLSQAVVVAVHEVFRAGIPAAPPPPAPALATHAQKEEMLALLRAGLLALDALPRIRPDDLFRDFVALVHRLDLTPREIRLMAHVARRMSRRR